MTMTEAANDLKEGRVVGIAGPVIDVEFPPNTLPELNTAVQFEIELEGETIQVLAEVVESKADYDFREEAIFWMVMSETENAFAYIDRLIMGD